ncbi:penicillin-binding protein 1B [Thalassomonas actiniarum]|uniref:Penicillin-binding protein 1B n=1 Tax=Thalassomonas actiniarum TaxID=485447 RepID=A0AAE9YQ59_9GAMM|nr:penicillin-binding protein 1B [Thalassomonas actiniarum]WDD98223.1 penicillin-binding protein 1B [Thalassomonas actiniarum]
MAKKKATSSKSSKKSSKQKPQAKAVARSRGWLRWLFFTGMKLTLVALLALGGYAIYLDGKVRRTFEGQKWQVPVQVFGRTETLLPGEPLDLPALASSLTYNGYQKVAKVSRPGQFALSKKRIIIFRRAFDFGSGIEAAAELTVDVSQGQISRLYLGSEQAAQLVLEPVLLDRIVPENKEDRVLVGLENVPEALLDTLLLVEDRDFYFHAGVSPLGILRALVQNIRAGRTVQGGSTLTQQLVKNMFLTRQKTLWRKVNEALMSLILEYRYSKDQLLEAYVNEVYLGQHYANGIYGFGLAAKFYFGKSVNQLDAGEMALLIGQIKGPSYYDPWRYPERAKKRRDLILRLMYEHHLLSQPDFEQALNDPLSVRKSRRLVKQKYPAYLQQVKRELSQHLENYRELSDIKVFTGFSHRSQALLEQTITERLAALEKSSSQQELQAAMLVTDIASGEIRALSGGRKSNYSGFNRALNARRPVGSLIKPAVYLAALERYEEYNFATVLDDKAITLASDGGKEWRPKNYDGKYREQVSLIDSLVLSLNIPTVNLGMSLGLDAVADAIHLLGYQQDITTRPSLLLGSINMSPMEINQLYLPIAAQGAYQQTHTITHIVSGQGESLWQFARPAEPRMSENAAYLLDYALEQVTQRGTARSLSWRLKDKQVAGKTGTTNDLRDSWFIGYDARHLVTTWVGRDDNKSMGLTGSSGALVLFADFLKQQGVVEKQVVMPEGIAMTLFERQSGNAVTDECDNTELYPAISLAIRVNENCLQKRPDTRSWLERLLGK